MTFFSCPCRQLTIRETAGDAGGRENSEAGYVHRLEFNLKELCGKLRTLTLDFINGLVDFSYYLVRQHSYESRLYLYR